MAQTRVNLGEWLPDQPGLVGALTVAKNCYPKAVGYGPFPEEVEYSNAADQNLNNVVAVKDSSGNTRVFASGSTKLYLLDAATFNFSNVSGTTYGAVSDKWRFTQFGTSLIAANGSDTLQVYNVNTSDPFTGLAADAPKAKYVTVVRDFVVSGRQADYSTRVQWSGINNEATWTPSGTTQADYQDIPDGGQIQGVTGGEFGLVLLERSIVRMSYVGTPLVFQFDNISRNLGCYEPNSVIQWQGITYFLGDDGFYACDGQQVVGIGAEKINRYFFASLKEADIQQMSAAVDPIRNLVIWGYRTIDSDYRLLVYHIPTKRWSFVSTTANRIASSSTPGFTLEQLDNYSNNIDNIEVPLDDRVWQGGRLQFAGTKGGKIIVFSGENKTATFDTSDIETGQSQSMITMVKPLVDNGSGSVTVESRLRLDEQVNFGSVTAANSENRVGVRSYGRYHRIRLQPSGDNWTSAIGVDIEIQGAGSR